MRTKNFASFGIIASSFIFTTTVLSGCGPNGDHIIHETCQFSVAEELPFDVLKELQKKGYRINLDDRDPKGISIEFSAEAKPHMVSVVTYYSSYSDGSGYNVARDEVPDGYTCSTRAKAYLGKVQLVDRKLSKYVSHAPKKKIDNTDSRLTPQLSGGDVALNSVELSYVSATPDICHASLLEQRKAVLREIPRCALSSRGN